MKVFISCSGERSKKVAELLNDWMKCVIQAVEPWISSKDIDRGAIWFSEINDQLANTCAGIVCLTQQNKNKPWILFESGALAKGISSNRVCTFLIDLKSKDIENPLAQFNATFPNKDSVWRLIKTINSSLEEKALKENVLGKAFDTYWPEFETRFEAILKNTPDEEIKESRSEDEILTEVLSSIRVIDKRIRRMENEGKHNIDDSYSDTPPQLSYTLPGLGLPTNDVGVFIHKNIQGLFTEEEKEILMKKMRKKISPFLKGLFITR